MLVVVPIRLRVRGVVAMRTDGPAASAFVATDVLVDAWSLSLHKVFTLWLPDHHNKFMMVDNKF